MYLPKMYNNCSIGQIAYNRLLLSGGFNIKLF